MLKFISTLIFAGILYFLGNLIYERYEYISDRRAWVEQGQRMACTSDDNARLLAHLRSEVLDPVKQRITSNNLSAVSSEIEFQIKPFHEQRMEGFPFGMPLCTVDNLPWRQRKGGSNEGQCSFPARLHCSAHVVVKVPIEIIKEADLAASYLPLQPFGGSETIMVGDRSFELFKIEAGLSKPVERFTKSRGFAEEQREGKASGNFNYNLSNLSGVVENWLQYHENREKVRVSYEVANDIGGAKYGGGFFGSINKLKNEQIQLPPPDTGK